jgi:hypothetical protein
MLVYPYYAHIKNNCTLCKYFTSYAEDSDHNFEPEDQGFCEKGKNDNYGDATITCELFQLKENKKCRL